jgi:hypothetical protein
MAKDVIITPASGLIDFKNASGVSVSTIQLADNGTFSVGNTASNLYIGDGTNSVDIIFEQNGKIRALTGKTLTLGQSDSTVNLNAPLTYTSPDGTKTVTTSMLNSGALSFTGSTGQLLSVTNSFTGTIFSVNDVSGVPSIEVLDTGVLKLGQYGGNVLLGTGVDDGVNKLQVNGNITANAFTGNGANLTGLTAGNLSGTIPSAVLGNSTHYVGTTAIALNRASASLALTGITSIDGSAASVTNAVTFNNGGTGDASGTTFNGSAAKTISYNSIGASPLAGSSSITTTGTVTSGTWSGSFGAVSGANLTGLTAGNLSGTIPSAVLGNSTHYVGTTAIVLNRSSASQTLTGVNIDGNAATVTTPTFSGDSVDKDDITTRTESGFYQTSTGTTAEGWPVNSTQWQHMIACTHSNDANYYSMQIGGSFFDNLFYGRKVNGSGTTAWVNFLTSGNYTTYPAVNISGGVANQIHYQTAVNTTNFIAAPTTASTFLQWNGSSFTWASATAGDPTPSLTAINIGLI